MHISIVVLTTLGMYTVIYPGIVQYLHPNIENHHHNLSSLSHTFKRSHARYGFQYHPYGVGPVIVPSQWAK